MGLGDQAKHTMEDLGGKAKEATGDATDNEDLKAEGEADQTKASFKDAADKVKDGLRDVNKGLH
ncbi:MAG: CsbD family protein [Nocardioidaceae bacterium]|nr:CsbD family protein [Nocardioidaceae bacterium]